ncbi:unnamed protein product [Paramecium sonneborni]|uniref:Uncharacterized protein n=1 Tax=Paramecium sonneborni TaxID=65129 RepID=A0A8S1LBZ9_9CILI|nr:unnamed protein product [Paramecium sonneborni]
MLQISNQNDKEYFTYLKIIKETLTYILPNYTQYLESFQYIKITAGDVHMIILQLTNWLIFYYCDINGESNQFSLNINNILKPQIQNYFIHKHSLQEMKIYYKEKQLEKLENLIRNRILQKQQENTLVKIVQNRDISNQIYSYLKRKDIVNLELSCFNVSEILQNNAYWYELYKWKYGQTGFKQDAFNWKNKYVLQMKQ